jgi:hypothetical protein
MTDELERRLSAISRDLDDERRSSKNITRKCVETLDRYVRPALRATYGNPRLGKVGEKTACGLGDEPFLSVASEEAHTPADVLRFRCDGPRLEVFTTFRGRTDHYSVQLDDVDEVFIAGRIDVFLRLVTGLDLTPPEGP